MTDIISLSLSELVLNIKDKKISSKDITSSYIDRSIKSKHLNSYNQEAFDVAIEKANAFDENPDFNKKLPGIPIAVKSLIHDAGL